MATVDPRNSRLSRVDDCFGGDVVEDDFAVVMLDHAEQVEMLHPNSNVIDAKSLFMVNAYRGGNKATMKSGRQERMQLL